jgi:hypothetical protein
VFNQFYTPTVTRDLSVSLCFRAPLQLGHRGVLYSILYGYKDQQVARNLLTYRYNQLDEAIENAEKI